MAHLDLQPVWQLDLNTEELNLTLRALRGELREEELAQAQDLADALARARVNASNNRLKNIDKLDRALKAKGR